MDKLCAVCGQPMRYIKPGVSKTTGKPYQGFYACEDRTHKQPRPSNQANTYQGNANLVVKETPNWGKISFGKIKYGFMLEAWKMKMDIDVAETEAEEWTKRVMRILGEPDLTQYKNNPEADQIPF